MSRVLGGRYEILEKIGEGGMSVVYKAKCRLLHRYVAIKILKPEFLDDSSFIESFRRESQAAASLSHPNIVNIYDVGLEGKNIHYIVMEYVDGKTLSSIIAQEGRLSDYDTIQISKQIASALALAHENHIIHRDVKPHNILVTSDGTAKITDFGIAKAVNSKTLVAPGAIMGSVHYFSPEQARGGYVDGKSDIYSLGIVMYEMITGRVPFDGDNPVAVAMMQINDPITPPSKYAPRMSKSLEKIILKATEKYQVNRFSDAEELVEALESIDLDAEEELMAQNQEQGAFSEEENPQEGLGMAALAAAGYGGEGPASSETLVMGKDYEQELLQEQEEYEEEPDQEPEVRELPQEADMSQNEKAKKKGKKAKKPKGKTRVSKGKLFGVIFGIVAAFFASYFLWNFISTNSEPVTVPNVVGENYEDAQRMLEEMGLEMEIIDRVYDDQAEVGEVTSQSPNMGDRVKKGFTIKVSICQGQGQTNIPNVVGKSYDEAVLAITEAGYQLGDVSYEDNEAEKDTVLSQDPDSESQGGPETKIDLVLSSGKEPATMPNVVGKQKSSAQSQLNGLGVSDITFQYEYSDDIEEGVVMEQSVSEGARIDEDTSVQLVVSQGMDPAKAAAGQSGGETQTVPLRLDYTKSPNEVFRIKINMTQDGTVTMVHDEVHYKSDDGETIDVTGSGTATITVYYDDKLTYEGKLNFETGEFQ